MAFWIGLGIGTVIGFFLGMMLISLLCLLARRTP